MPIKSERLEVRVDAATKARIEDAAARLGQSASVFVIDAATAEADRVLARAEAMVMPAEQFDTLLAALDMPTRQQPWHDWPSATADTSAARGVERGDAGGRGPERGGSGRSEDHDPGQDHLIVGQVDPVLRGAVVVGDEDLPPVRIGESVTHDL